MTGERPDLTRLVLAVLFIAGMIAASLWVLAPFLVAIVWAATLVISTWPVLLAVQARLGRRRGPAVAVMTLLLLLMVVIPFWLAVRTVVQHLDLIPVVTRAVAAFQVPPPPVWLAGLPLVGGSLTEVWSGLVDAGAQDLLQLAAPYAGEATQRVFSVAGGLGVGFVHVLMTVVIAAILYAQGEAASALVHRFGWRLAGARGEEAVTLVGQAIRGVALGVVVTSVVQSMLAGLALAIAGVPLAALLAAVIFLLCLAQLGPGIVLIPTFIWMFYIGDHAWAVFLLVATVAITALEHVLRPILIRRGAPLPLLLILAGVLGGLVALGVVGIFLGPAVLAVSYTLLRAWLAEEPAYTNPP